MVKAMATFFGIPITVHVESLPEIVKRQVESYIEESCYLLKHVFDQSDNEVAKYDEWAYDLLMAKKDNPYKLHDHPFYLAAAWMGFCPGRSDHTSGLRAAELRLVKLEKEDKTYRERFNRARWLDHDEVSPEPVQAD
jgi:hypothetical protein